jgi:hypothetical protein
MFLYSKLNLENLRFVCYRKVAIEQFSETLLFYKMTKMKFNALTEVYFSVLIVES